MRQTALLKNDIEVLDTLNDPSVENINIVIQMLDSGKAIRQLWTHLNEKFKTNPEIQIAYIKHIHNNSFNSIRELLETEGGLSTETFFALLKEHNPKFFEHCVKMNKMPMDIKIESIVENPKFAQYLTMEDPIKEIIDMQPEAAAYLSSRIPHTIEVLGENGIDKTSFWKNDGQPIQHFALANGLELTGRNDYIKLVHAYLQENTSIPEFCNRYMIDDTSAFAKVLSRVQKEDSSLDEQITEVKSSAQKRYVSSMQNLIANIVSGKARIKESIEKFPTINAYHFLDAKSFIDETTYNQLLSQIALEMGLYKSRDSKRVPDKYGVEFPLIGNLTIETLIQWFSYADSTNPGKDVGIGFKKMNGICRFNSEIKNHSGLATLKLETLTSSFEQKINPDILLNNTSFVDKTNQVVKPSEENIQDAIAYLNATDRYLCQKNAKCVLRAIIQGTLTKDDILQAENEKAMKTAQKEAAFQARLEKVKNANTIDNYISDISASMTEKNVTPTSPTGELEAFYQDVAENDNLYTTKEAGKSTLHANPQIIHDTTLREDSNETLKENEDDDGYPDL